MIIPLSYTPIQFVVTDDKLCISIHYIWNNIYLANRDTYSYISHVSLAKKYNLIYALVKTDNLKLLNYPYTTVPLISAENIEFYKLNNNICLILKEENDMQVVINYSETQYWFKDREYHRDNDLAAIIHHNGTQEWYKNGSRHRDNDLPAIIYDDGSKLWYKHGVLYDNPY